MTPETATVRLPAVLDLNAAAPLKAELLAHRGSTLELDASEVRRLGGLCLQVLLAAQTTWAADGAELRFGAASDSFQEAWALFGAPALTLSEPVQ